MRRNFTIGVMAWIVLATGAGLAFGQGQAPGGDRKPLAPKQAALIDITGYWVSIVDEDWRWKMFTPPKGDTFSIPLNAEGHKATDTWDLDKDNADGNQCRAYGAAGLMRMPTRVHITWADDNTMQVDTDAGTQTRLFHFDGGKWKYGDPLTWQGDSVATWEKQRQSRGFAPRSAPVPGMGGTLHVVTTHMKPGYYRKNGIPYSENATLIEYYDRVELGTQPYLILTTVVQDPKYLNDQFITSEQFKWEPDGAKWHPAPCYTDKPVR